VKRQPAILDTNLSCADSDDSGKPHNGQEEKESWDTPPIASFFPNHTSLISGTIQKVYR
jgi:hypothetical protein